MQKIKNIEVLTELDTRKYDVNVDIKATGVTISLTERFTIMANGTHYIKTQHVFTSAVVDMSFYLPKMLEYSKTKIQMYNN